MVKKRGAEDSSARGCRCRTAEPVRLEIVIMKGDAARGDVTVSVTSVTKSESDA